MNPVAIASTAPVKVSAINLDRFTDLLEHSSVQERLDLGSTLIYKATHPVDGSIILINTSGEQHAVVYS